MTTPNATGIKRYTISAIYGDPHDYDDVPDESGRWVEYDDHLAALSRARDEARREALEEAAAMLEQYAENTPMPPHRDGFEALMRQHRRQGALKDGATAIRALIPNTPQGKTKEDHNAR